MPSRTVMMICLRFQQGERRETDMFNEISAEDTR